MSFTPGSLGVTLETLTGRSHTLVFRTIDYQLVIKCGVET